VTFSSGKIYKGKIEENDILDWEEFEISNVRMVFMEGRDFLTFN